MVGVFAHDRPQSKAIGKLERIVPEMQYHLGAAVRIRVLHRKFILAGRCPTRTLVGTGATGEHFDLLRNDKGAVETDAELTNQGRVLLLIAGEPFEKFSGTGLGYRAQVVDDFFTRHADAVVFDRHGLGIGVEADGDREITVIGQELRLGDRAEAQSIDGIGPVGDQLPQENLPVGVQGLDHQF